MAEQILGARVQNSFFHTLGVVPFLGRVFLPEEHQEGHDQAAITSYSLWERRLGGDPKVLGKTVTLDGKPYTIVGVMPDGFHFPGTEPPAKTDLWLPWSAPASGFFLSRDVDAIARLKPGVTLARARVEMDAIAERLARAYPADKGWRFDLVPLLESKVGAVKHAILVLFAAVGFVLLIATANVANLLLARATGRRKEMAVRAAIGASRSRIIRQLLMESVLLALAGGALGLILAFWGVDLVRALAPRNIPRLADVCINRPVLLFTIAASLAVGLLFGIAPAVQASRVSLQAAFKEGFTGASGGWGLLRHNRSRNLLVISQVALSLVLLTGAGLLIKSFLRLTSVHLGINPDHVLTFWVYLTADKYSTPSARLNFYQQTLDRVRSLPGVESAGVTSFLPLSGYAATSFTITERPAPPKGQEPQAGYKAISPEYFHVMQIPLTQGRNFTDHDGPGAPPVMIVDRTFVERFFPHEDPLGKRLHLHWGHEPAWREIVGVVGDVRDIGLNAAPPPEFYVPLSQAWVTPSLSFVVRTRSKPLSLASAVRHTVFEVDKDQPISELETMDQIFSNVVSQPRFHAMILGIFSIFALSLTAIGLYGVLSYAVTQRTHEIGIRMALGARRKEVLGLVIRQGMMLAGAGMALGLVGALLTTRFLSAMLYAVQATDAATFGAVALLLAAVALGAAYIPARRATKVDPMVALRYE